MSTVHGGQGNIITNGLVLNLDAANPRSYPPPYNGTTWFDLNGSNNAAFINGPTFNTGSNGSINFDGSNDYASISNYDLDNQTGLSIFAYIYPNTVTGFRWIINKRNNTGDAQWQINIVDNILYSTIFGGSSAGIGTVSSSIVNNAWYHVGFSTIGTTNGNLTLYVNGTPRHSLLLTGNRKTGSRDVIIGTDAWSGFPGFALYNGRIASTQIYNRALSATEVLQNFNATRARFGI